MSSETGQDEGNITNSKPDLLFMNRGQLSANAVQRAWRLYSSGSEHVFAVDRFIDNGVIGVRSAGGGRDGHSGDGHREWVGGVAGSVKGWFGKSRRAMHVVIEMRREQFFLSGQGGLPMWPKENHIPETRKQEDKR